MILFHFSRRVVSKVYSVVNQLLSIGVEIFNYFRVKKVGSCKRFVFSQDFSSEKVINCPIFTHRHSTCFWLELFPRIKFLLCLFCSRCLQFIKVHRILILMLFLSFYFAFTESKFCTDLHSQSIIRFMSDVFLSGFDPWFEDDYIDNFWLNMFSLWKSRNYLCRMN